MNRISKNIINKILVLALIIFSFSSLFVQQAKAASVGTLIADSETFVGKETVFEVNAATANKPLYEFWLYSEAKSTWSIVQAYSEQNTFHWTPDAAGNYRVSIHIKDINSSKDYDTYVYKDIVVKAPKKTRLFSFDSTSSDYTVGQVNVLSGNAISVNGPLYAFWLNNSQTGKWTLLKDFSEANSYEWTPTSLGNFRIVMHVKDKNSSKSYDVYSYKDIVVKTVSDRTSIQQLKVNDISYTGKEQIISGQAVSATKPLYKFWVANLSTGEWTVLHDYSEAKQVSWTPQFTGNFRVVMHVKDSVSTKEYDRYTYKDVVVKPIDALSKISKFDIAAKMVKDKSYTITTSATSGTRPLYEYALYDAQTGEWSIAQEYSENSTFEWVPNKFGKYRIVVHVKDQVSNKAYDVYRFKDVEVLSLSDITEIQDFTTPKISRVGIVSKFSLEATSETKPLYAFWLSNKSTGEWTLLQPYGEKNTLDWVPQATGDYRITVHVKDVNSSLDYDKYIYKDFSVYSKISVMLDPGHGGYDSGAYQNGLFEKTLNLRLANLVKEKLESNNIQVYMTRTTDTFVSLEDRAAMANRIQPSLFLSIHHDSSINPSADGISTHYSTYRVLKPRSDEYVIYKGRKYPFIKEQKISEDLTYIYFKDGSRTRYVDNDYVVVYDPTPSEAAVTSKVLAERMAREVASLGFDKAYTSSGAKDHNLYVTRWTTMPSVLIEAGFISNPIEARIVSSPEMENKIAEKIVVSILSTLGIK